MTTPRKSLVGSGTGVIQAKIRQPPRRPRDNLVAWLQTIPFRWSLLIGSGGGIHGYLLFRELWLFANRGEAERAQALMANFQYTLRTGGKSKAGISIVQQI